jgi:hypothetical protein
MFCHRGKMDLKGPTLRFPIFIFLFVLSLTFACSTPSWFPIKKGPPHKAKMKELLDREVLIIDKQEYVKVYNPRASEGGNEPKYLYIPIDEYLSKRETFTTPAIQAKKEPPISSLKPSPSPIEKEVFSVSPSISTTPDLKKKVLITHFDDRTTNVDEEFGDWVAEKLIKELNRRSTRLLSVDYQMIKEFLEKEGVALTDLETPKVLHLLNEVFGIHALVVGHLSGPYAFTTKANKGQDEMASAIIKIEMRLVDTFTDKTIKTLSAINPLLAVKEKGNFPEEKAKVKAIDLTIAELSRSLSRELDGLDWFCRIAKVDGEEVYINAGRLTGLKLGDVMEVFPSGGPGERGEVKGRIQISAFFGVDASLGRMVQGKKPDANDILKLAKGAGT